MGEYRRQSQPSRIPNEGEGRPASRDHDPGAPSHLGRGAELPLPPQLPAAGVILPGESPKGYEPQSKAAHPLVPQGPWPFGPHNTPGHGAITVLCAPGVPSAARTPTWKVGGTADSAAAAAGGGRLPWPANWCAGWQASRGAGAACAEPRSPVPTAAAAAVLRLQWAAAAAPPLPRAGRASGAALWAPRPRLAGCAGVEPSAVSAGAALPPCGAPLTESLGKPQDQTFDGPGLCAWGHLRLSPRGTPGVQRSPLGIPGLKRHRSNPACPSHRRWTGPDRSLGPDRLQWVARNVTSARGLERSR